MAINLHSQLPDATLHNPKGFAFASAGTKVTRDEKSELNWQTDLSLPAALSFATATSVPPTEVDGDIYVLLGGTPHGDWDGASENDWVRFDGTSGTWKAITPTSGTTCLNIASGDYKIWNGSAWVNISSGDTNFSTADLTFSASRVHDIDTNVLSFQTNAGSSSRINWVKRGTRIAQEVTSGGANIFKIGVNHSTSTAFDGTWSKNGYLLGPTSNASFEQTATNQFRLYISGGSITNLLLGNTSSGPQQIAGDLVIRDDVTGGANVTPSARFHVIGGGTTSATTTFLVENNSNVNILEINDAKEIGFFNTTPIGQPSSTGETVGFTAGAGTGVNDDSTFTGNVGATAYRISDIVKHLKNLGLIAQ